jgi:hypothetical protein
MTGFVGHQRRVRADVRVTALTALLALALGACGSDSPRASSSAADGAKTAGLVQIALVAAKNAGDPRPTLVQYSEGTRRHANLVDSGDIVPGAQRSYLIAERGHFTLKDASIPAGAQAPTGSVLTLVVNARTHQVTDGGVSNRYPDLAKLGPVTTGLRARS